MERKQCVICHQNVRVPVSFTPTCFHCHQPKRRPWCHSIIRVCVLCARDYLQMNRPLKDRELSKKCLLCAKTCNPKLIRSAEEVYTKDYSYMSMDPQIYPCFHFSCSFQGTHHELDSHLQEECEFRRKSCEHCREVYVASTEMEHRKHCSFYNKCPHTDCEVRDVYVLRAQIHTHLLESHHSKMCRHEGCVQLFPADTDELLTHEERECPHRTVPCSFCTNGFLCSMSHYKIHVAQHISSQQTKISTLIEETNQAHSQLELMMQIHRILMKDSLTWNPSLSFSFNDSTR